MISNTIVSIAEQDVDGFLENKVFHLAFSVLLFLVIFLLVWFVCIKYAIPKFSEIFYKEEIDIRSNEQKDLVHQFNCEIMQEVAEVNEIVTVIRKTKIEECKMLNFVMALYKFQDIVDFLNDNFGKDNNNIRKTKEDGATELIRFSFNCYTVSSVIKTVLHIKEEMEKTLLYDNTIKKLSGYDLLLNDFQKIIQKIENFKEYS